MTGKEVTKKLKRLASSENFASDSEALCDELIAAAAGIEVVGLILQFMEQHPSVDFGIPGPLVHFVEEFYRNGYEGELLASIKRKPTPHTAWMLNRLINGTAARKERKLYAAAMEQAKTHPLVDELTLETIQQFADD